MQYPKFDSDSDDVPTLYDRMINGSMNWDYTHSLPYCVECGVLSCITIDTTSTSEHGYEAIHGQYRAIEADLWTEY